MIATHLGNAIVRYDDVLAIDKDYMSGLYERLNQLNAGDHQYTFSEIEVSKAPQRFIELQRGTSSNTKMVNLLDLIQIAILPTQKMVLHRLTPPQYRTYLHAD